MEYRRLGNSGLKVSLLDIPLRPATPILSFLFLGACHALERWCRGGKVGQRGFIPIFFEATHQG